MSAWYSELPTHELRNYTATLYVALSRGALETMTQSELRAMALKAIGDLKAQEVESTESAKARRAAEKALARKMPDLEMRAICMMLQAEVAKAIAAPLEHHELVAAASEMLDQMTPQQRLDVATLTQPSKLVTLQ